MDFSFLTVLLPMLFRGLKVTLMIAGVGITLGFIIGCLSGYALQSHNKIAKIIANVYIWIIRGTPLMVQLMFIFYGLPMIGFTIPDVSWIPNFSRFTAGIVAMSMNSCAYVAEIIRSGIESVDPGQMEAARSIGFGPVRSMMMIVVPQAVKNILPNFGNEFANLIKASSQVMVIGVAELMFTFNTVSATGRVFTPLLVIAVLYFAMTFTVGRGVHLMEKPFKKADR